MSEEYRYGTPIHVRACQHAAAMIQTNWSILRSNDEWVTQLELVFRSAFAETKPEAITAAAGKYIATCEREFPPPAGLIVKSMRKFIGNSKLKTVYQDCDRCDKGLILMHYWELVKEMPRMQQIYASCTCEAGKKKKSMGILSLKKGLEILQRKENLLKEPWIQTEHNQKIPMEEHYMPNKEYWSQVFEAKNGHQEKPLATILHDLNKKFGIFTGRV